MQSIKLKTQLLTSFLFYSVLAYSFQLLALIRIPSFSAVFNVVNGIIILSCNHGGEIQGFGMMATFNFHSLGV